MRASRLASLACLLVLAAGCGHKATKPVVPADGLPAGTPAADSPTHLATRFEATFDSQVEAEYAKLLTDDFRFRFSVETDPNLVAQYGNDWTRIDEIASVTHLFDGFTDTFGNAIPGASRVAMTLNGIQVGVDSTHADSTDHYHRLVITQMQAEIEVPTSPDPVVYALNSRQELYLVRGDAAVLAAGQAATADRWYIRRWDDLSVNFGAGKGPVGAAAAGATVGRLKSQYR